MPENYSFFGGRVFTITLACGNQVFQLILICEVNDKVILQGSLISSKMGNIQLVNNFNIYVCGYYDVNDI